MFFDHVFPVKLENDTKNMTTQPYMYRIFADFLGPSWSFEFSIESLFHTMRDFGVAMDPGVKTRSSCRGWGEVVETRRMSKMYVSIVDVYMI